MVSQNKKMIMPMNNMVKVHKHYGKDESSITCSEITLGTYDTEERAKEVLIDMMGSLIQGYKVYRMPEK
jgi:hypothetical protein